MSAVVLAAKALGAFVALVVAAVVVNVAWQLVRLVLPLSSLLIARSTHSRSLSLSPHRRWHRVTPSALPSCSTMCPSLDAPSATAWTRSDSSTTAGRGCVHLAPLSPRTTRSPCCELHLVCRGTDPRETRSTAPSSPTLSSGAASPAPSARSDPTLSSTASSHTSTPKRPTPTSPPRASSPLSPTSIACLHRLFLTRADPHPTLAAASLAPRSSTTCPTTSSWSRRSLSSLA